jgi:AbrB family looped-hinge helix DNA binding protein
MEIAKVTSKGQITVPIDVRRKLGLNEGNRLLFIERDNGFFIVNENHIDINSIGGSKTKIALTARWSDDYIAAITAFGETPDSTFTEPADIAWTDRGELF